MTTKWSDKLISAVRFNEAETHIDKARVHNDDGDTVSSPSDMKRSDIISLLKNDTTFATIYKNADGKWKFGAKVNIVKIRGVEYIKTHSDDIESDNLDDLPRF